MATVKEAQEAIQALENELTELQTALDSEKQKLTEQESILTLERVAAMRSAGNDMSALAIAESGTLKTTRNIVAFEATIEAVSAELQKALEILEQTEQAELQQELENALQEAREIALEIDTGIDMLESKVSALETLQKKYSKHKIFHRRHTPAQTVCDVLNARLVQPFKVSQDSRNGSFAAYIGLDGHNKT